jgi:hypothetical protein
VFKRKSQSTEKRIVVLGHFANQNTFKNQIFFPWVKNELQVPGQSIYFHEAQIQSCSCQRGRQSSLCHPGRQRLCPLTARSDKDLVEIWWTQHSSPHLIFPKHRCFSLTCEPWLLCPHLFLVHGRWYILSGQSAIA